MSELLATATLFMLRVGIPLLVVLVIGALMEHGYNKRMQA